LISKKRPQHFVLFGKIANIEPMMEQQTEPARYPSYLGPVIPLKYFSIYLFLKDIFILLGR